MEQDQIEQLMVKRLAGMSDAGENSLLDKLITDSPASKAHWEELCAMAGSKDMKGFAKSLDVERAWDEFQTIVAPPRPSRLITFRRLSAAAAVIIMVGGAVLFFTQRKPGKTLLAVNKSVSTQPVSEGIRLETADGEVLALDGQNAAKTFNISGIQLNNDNQTLTFEGQGAAGKWNLLTVPAKLDYKVVLADGSQVWLNASSQLRFPFAFSGDQREVFVDGEAYFKIAANAAQPFIVHIGDTRVEVLGTEFNVNNYGKKTVTASLLKGAVAVNREEERVVLKPGNEVVCSETGKMSVQAFGNDNILEWTEGTYRFNKTPLSVMTEVIPRLYDVQVVFDNKEIAGLMFTGVINKHDELSGFLRTLELAVDAKYYYKEGVLHIK